MLNNDLYEKMEETYGRENMLLFSQMVSDMYKHLCMDFTNDQFIECEYDFERDWWQNKNEQLKTIYGKESNQ